MTRARLRGSLPTVLALLLAWSGGCAVSDDDGDGSSGGVVESQACDGLESTCPELWELMGEARCGAVVACFEARYSAECRQRVDTLESCLSGLGAGECDRCDDALDDLTSNCPFLPECFEDDSSGSTRQGDCVLTCEETAEFYDVELSCGVGDVSCQGGAPVDGAGSYACEYSNGRRYSCDYRQDETGTHGSCSGEGSTCMF